jgi:hypothetical protein
VLGAGKSGKAAGDLGHRVIVACGALALTGITVFAVVASRAPTRTALALTGGIEADECPGGPLVANIPPGDVVVLAGSTYEGHLGHWRAVTWDNTSVRPAITRSVWVTDADLRRVVADPGTITDGQVIGDPAFDNGCNPSAAPEPTALGRQVTPTDSTLPGTRPAETTPAETSATTPGITTAAPTAPKVTLAPRPTRATVAPGPTTPTVPATPSTAQGTQPTHTTETTAAPKVIVPDLRGSSSADASQRLTDLGLAAKVLSVDLKFHDPRIGFVVTQLPDPGTTVDPGSTVTIGVGHEGPALVPDVLDESYDDAINAIESVGLKVHVTEVSDEGTGLVIAQNPAGGSFRPVGSTVEITVDTEASNTTVDNGGVD